MDALPDELLLKIFSSLDFSSLISVGRVNKRLGRLSNLDVVWKPLCAKLWLIESIESAPKRQKSIEFAYRRVFENSFREYGRYISVYAELKSLWNDIFRITSERLPELADSLLPGASEQSIDGAISQHYSMPDDVRCSYRICAGQPRDCNIGIFGTYSVESPGWILHNIGDRTIDNLTHLKFDDGDRPAFMLIKIAGRHVVPTFHKDDLYLYLSRTDSARQHETDYQLPSGLLLCSGAMGLQRSFVIADSFIDFLREFRKNISEYPAHDSRYFRYTLNSRLSTGPFTVTTRTVLLPELCQMDEDHRPVYFFGYYITMEMDQSGNAADSCQLETRHWVITDLNGHVEMVDGPGVVGQYPVMRPGASHYWISGTNFETPGGQMKGHFVMRNLATGRETIIECPTFKMRVPRMINLIEGRFCD